MALPLASVTHSCSEQGLPQIGQRGEDCGLVSESTEREVYQTAQGIVSPNNALLFLWKPTPRYRQINISVIGRKSGSAHLLPTLRLVAPQKMIAGLASAGMSGTPLTLEECARRVLSIGLQRSASLADAGRRTPSGMRPDKNIAPTP